ncbi:D-alanine--poly(phosphoribitol) ligase subunit DltA [Heyndrickxia ginsengihumi]|uniref:D-alanine--D-alanyl carrier protein ligase n=1 Tax=Heyndrickxia ginsengihumi TaxID=363870 RepID=A0A6M0P7Z9_9BACI|nr:D-alanine--poly(phosphoribitol) ligase subunit DltA [Heyndrickxia ginsengihumi]MBE6185113.1 D-alanine--poly(phosphoribitol) ligase subunit DltA [Bacillus sp. (in: firmicutes)]NEY20796.1 D-alanine--poly(phosphoribitol) ligase subunit DltA [Heyndrickxia ginsengihumi]
MRLLTNIRQIALDHPERIAYRDRSRTLTYAALWQSANQLASYLIKNCKQSKSPIIVYGHMESDMIISFLGSVLAGHPYIPVDSSIPLDRIKSIIDSSNAEYVLAIEQLDEQGFSQYPITFIRNEELQQIINESIGQVPETLWVSNEDCFYILYTSGSTGKPKGVQITANNLQSFIDWILADLPLRQQMIFMNQAPFSFDLSVMDLYPALYTGGRIFPISKDLIAKPTNLFKELQHSGIQVWTSTPSFAQMCLMEPTFTNKLLPALEVFLFCGEVLTPETARHLHERFPKAKIVNLYGPTEATVAVTMVEITKDMYNNEGMLPIGACKQNANIFIADKNGHPLPDGEKGEITIVGPSVSKGYLGEQTLTKKAFFIKDGVRAYRTGDVGFRKDGYLYYQGRLDFQVKVHGYRMELEEIEHHLSKSPYIKACVVVPVKHNGEIHYLNAVIVPAKHSFEKEYQLTSAIKKDLMQVLPSYMIPRKFSYYQQLPITANGKIDRKALSIEGLR